MAQQRLQGLFLTIIGVAGVFGGVLFAIEAPKYTPVPVVFLSFWLVMVIVGQVLFAGLRKLRAAGVGAPAPEQVRAAAAVAAIVVAVGMMGFAATTAGTGSAQAAPCPGGGPATCGPTPGQPELTFSPPAQATAPGQQGQQGAQQGSDGIATSPAGSGGDNGPGIQAQTPDFGTPGQPTPNIPGNEPDQPAQQPAQGQGQQQGNQQQQNPVQTTAAGRPQQGQQTGEPTQSGQASPSQSTVTITQTQSECPAPAAPGAGGPGTPGNGGEASGPGAGGPDGGDSKDGAPSWAYLVGEVTALMTGRRGRKAGPLNADGSAPTNDTVPGDLVEGENYKQWTTPDGDRTFILSENADAPSKYRFNLDQPEGGSSKVNDDGSVSVFDRDGNQVKRFEAPWAYDTKTGEKIPTRYSVDGDDLVQTIDRPEGNNNPILADPDETNVGMINTTGRQDGESWTETRPNGETLTHTIVPGSGGQSVDTRATRPDGSFTDIRTASDGQGGWQAWADNSDGSSSYAGQEGAGGDHYSQRYDGSPLDGQAPRVTSTGNADNSQGTITGTNYDGTQSTGDYSRTGDNQYDLTTQNPNGSTSNIRSEIDPNTGNPVTVVADDDGVKMTTPDGKVVPAIPTPDGGFTWEPGAKDYTLGFTNRDCCTDKDI
ncbi:hypothetical protein [Tsukamurella paurometabola]|uniref:Uncharacterized protein n=2 Tax=Tsukamurella paurometabola TaxID=2061 RepID=A0A3P8L1D8_TSUPA|nr:hypothetical protein [Tsukamurella paurometabola]UEA81369.1 hypothetical protein LK411_13210 [Tsukamurella paurometabola]VDR38355.1 Uncharacterised protein [Tsukamurella paurometabola]